MCNAVAFAGTFTAEFDFFRSNKFFHSFWSFLQRLFKSTTTQRRSRLQHGYCIGVSCRSAQATVSKGLAQGPYVAARARVEPTTLQLGVIDLTNPPPRPTFVCTCSRSMQFSSLHILQNKTLPSIAYKKSNPRILRRISQKLSTS